MFSLICSCFFFTFSVEAWLLLYRNKTYLWSAILQRISAISLICASLSAFERSYFDSVTSTLSLGVLIACDFEGSGLGKATVSIDSMWIF